MNRFALTFALLAAGLFFVPSTANAQDFRVGVSIGFGRPHHGHHGRRYAPPIYVPAPRHCPSPVYVPAPPRCAPPVIVVPLPRPVYHAPIVVAVYEDVLVWEDSGYWTTSACGRYRVWKSTRVQVLRSVRREVTAHWYSDIRSYGYYDSYGTFHRV